MEVRRKVILKQKILFVCVHNSARSQMAEEILRQMAGDRFEVESAGLEPGTLNPLVVMLLKEDGINIEYKRTQAVKDILQKKRRYDYVITVCDESSRERCPIFPGEANRIHWDFPDPSQFQGTAEEKLTQTRQVKDLIKRKIQDWLIHAASAC